MLWLGRVCVVLVDRFVELCVGQVGVGLDDGKAVAVVLVIADELLIERLLRRLERVGQELEIANGPLDGQLVGLAGLLVHALAPLLEGQLLERQVELGLAHRRLVV